YEITYVRLKFHTSRPESFAIYKRSRAGGPWEPYQFYSASCGKTYGRPEGHYLRPGQDERVAFCTSEFSDISPLSGGNVAFSTLEGRPSAYNFEESPALQEWVTSTELLISLDRLNTFGDDIFKDPKVLQSYYYAVSDFSVGGRCKCNGHASECGPDAEGRLVCRCQHNTTGADCERCLPFFQDRPWARGTAEAANECLPCNCSGHSEQCVFDQQLFRSTGHGGRCLHCRDHTAGPHCQLCQENFYRWKPWMPCQPCDCHPAGSLRLQCDDSGTCSCKATVTGWKCDRCLPRFHSLSEGGCRPCTCHPAGSLGACDPRSGRCPCKENVEGSQCDRNQVLLSGRLRRAPGCRPGLCLFIASSSIPYTRGQGRSTCRPALALGWGCEPPAVGTSRCRTSSHLHRACRQHRLSPERRPLAASLGPRKAVRLEGVEAALQRLTGPACVLLSRSRRLAGRQRRGARAARTVEPQGPPAEPRSRGGAHSTRYLQPQAAGRCVALPGASGRCLYVSSAPTHTPLSHGLTCETPGQTCDRTEEVRTVTAGTSPGVAADGHSLPLLSSEKFLGDQRFRSLPGPLAEAPGRKFIFTLSSSFQRLRHSLRKAAPHVPMTSVLHAPPSVGSPAFPGPCCHILPRDSGCFRRKEGLTGAPPLPEAAPPDLCSRQVLLREVRLLSAQRGLSPPASWVETCSCPQGYVGQFCEACAPGYKRETPRGGPYANCVPCTCNQHGTCDPNTGECPGTRSGLHPERVGCVLGRCPPNTVPIRCLSCPSGICQCGHHTEGPSCERCLPGFYGNPFAGRADDCQPCPCPGQSSCTTIPESREVVCTHCPAGQKGRRCETCDDGFFGDPLGLSGDPQPCRRCQCSGNVDPNAVGNCDPLSGHCLRCLFNTTGARCERCQDGFYGSALAPRPVDKCVSCSCNPGGSVSARRPCDPVSGQCACLPHVTGRDCGRCSPGFYDLQPGRGCRSCTCHLLGSQENQCHPETGQCPCRPGVEGQACDRCQLGFFGFSIKGCRACRCSPLGSASPQCHENSTCVCRPGFVGYKCDRCQENFFLTADRARCQECPSCY
uniref:Laminin subunit gamma-3-like n=1 Tax=Myotis lucifugus TaxID=59463 RepID=G1Q107_MYOLU